MNDGMFLFKSFADTLRQMNDKDRLEAMDAIITYGVYGENPKLADGSIASMFFTMAKPVIDANNKQRSSGSKGGTNESSKHPSTNPASDNIYDKDKDIDKDKDKDNDKDKDKDKDIKKSVGVARTRFTPPTVDQVAGYCHERGNNVDANRFVDVYASKGWKVGSSPMKDWKAAVRTWEREDNRYSSRAAPSDDPVGDMLLRMMRDGDG